MQNLIKKASGLSMLAAIILSGAAMCHAAVYNPASPPNCNNYTGNARLECQLKDNFTFNVTTNWTGVVDASTNASGTVNMIVNGSMKLSNWAASTR